MWILNTEGDQIVRLFGKQSDSTHHGAEQREKLPSTSTGKGSYAVWPDVAAPEDDLPVLIVVAPGEVRGFVAWASTYLGSYRPFTGFCRVIDASQVKSVDSLKATPSLGKIADASVAVVVAEVLTHGRGRVDLKTLTLPMCLTTFSFATARCLALGYPESEIDAVGRNLSIAQCHATARPPSNAVRDSGDLAGAYRTACHTWAKRGRQPIQRSRCDTSGHSPKRRFERRCGTSSFQWCNRTAGSVEGDGGTPRGPCAQFDRSLGMLAGSHSRNRVSSEALAGYIASLLSPGTFEYVDLISSFSDRLPGLLLWYGLFTGIHPANTVLFEHGGLGRKLLREILTPESVLTPPKCDISVEELAVLTERTSAFDFYRQSRQSSLSVEVLPLINVVVPTSSRPRPETSEPPADQESWRRMGWMLDEIGAIFRKLAPKEQARNPEPPNRGKDRKKRK